MSDTDLCYISATKALELFRSKELSPVELLQACITRAEAVEPSVFAAIQGGLAQTPFRVGVSMPLRGYPRRLPEPGFRVPTSCSVVSVKSGPPWQPGQPLP